MQFEKVALSSEPPAPTSRLPAPEARVAHSENASLGMTGFVELALRIAMTSALFVSVVPSLETAPHFMSNRG